MKMARPEIKYRAPALEKGLDILELLSSIDTPIAMPQIAAELNRSKSEIFRMATVLENRGYIERVKGTENFVVTNRLFAIGMQNPAKRNLIEVASAPMREPAESINQSCHLAVASGNQIVVIYGTEAIGYISFSSLGMHVGKTGRFSALAYTCYSTGITEVCLHLGELRLRHGNVYSCCKCSLNSQV